MRVKKLLCCMAATATTVIAQVAYPSASSTLSVSSVPSASSAPTDSLAPSASSATTLMTTSAPPPSSSSVQMTTHVMPMNCTEACTTVNEPCPESPVATTPAPYGTGSWTPPPAPPATGGYVRPPTPESSTWVMPTGPSATPEPAPEPSSTVTPYTGDAAGRFVRSGLVLAMVGLLQLAV